MAVREQAPNDERQARLLGKAVSRARQFMGLRQAQVAAMLGLSEASASRLESGDYVLPPGSKPRELAVLLVRIFRSLDAIVGGREGDMQAWLHSRNRGVNGVPAELMTTTEGMVRVLNYLDANRGLV